MAEATLRADGKELASLPIVESTEGGKAVDIQHLRRDAGLVTLDPGYGNTAEAVSGVTYIDGEEGVLRYRGYPIGQLAEQSSFLETAWLLDRGELPSQSELDSYREEAARLARLPDGFTSVLESFPAGAHPMQKLAAAAALLGAYFPGAGEPADPESARLGAVHLIAKMPALAAWSHRSGADRTYIDPRPGLGYAADFLNMMFHPGGGADHRPDPSHAEAMEALLILHADHGQNLSTSAVRVVGSSLANLFSAVAAGVLGLSGPLHGGANQRVIEMLEAILAGGGDPGRWLERAKDRRDPFRLMGFGHRVYRNFDPRSDLIKRHARRLLGEQDDPLLELALRLEQEALADDFFIQRRIYPNVDFYSGILYRALGFPSEQFTVLFALGRLPGWLAQWREMIDDPQVRIKRPRQIYTGYTRRDYTPIDRR